MLENKWLQVVFLFLGSCLVWAFFSPVGFLNIGELVGAGIAFTLGGLIGSTIMAAVLYQLGMSKSLWPQWHVWAAAPVALFLMVLAHEGYIYGESVSASKEKRSLPQTREQVEQEDPEAQFLRGYNYAKGRGVPQDETQAAKWHKKAAEQGHSGAQYNLGFLYAYGRGVPQDDAQALKWYRKAAEQGHVLAQFTLGRRYETGDRVLQNYTKAAKWYEKAAEQGFLRAKRKIGNMYQHGRGVLQDHEQALKWFRKAAEQGDMGAMSDLAFMYAESEGMFGNFTMVHKWLNIAAAHGAESSAQQRDRLSPGMTPVQLAEAQKLAREWMKKHRE